jgi:hypothetical protein
MIPFLTNPSPTVPPQLSGALVYRYRDQGKVHLSASDRTRFPTMVNGSVPVWRSYLESLA